MKKSELSYVAALPVSLNILRVHRRLNLGSGRQRPATDKSGTRRHKAAQRANLKRMDEARLFRRNAFR